MSQASARRTYDVFDLEHAVVATRNRLKFRLSRKDDPSAIKYFVIGHPKTGTTSFHHMFQSAGLNSRHYSGFWDTAKYDCFSDRGNFQPIDLYKAHYPNAVYILNCRPLGPHLRSVAFHLGNNWYPHKTLTPQAFINYARRRNDYFARVAALFREDENLIVANIQRKGIFVEVAQRLGLSIDRDNFHGKKGAWELKPALDKSVTEAIERLNLGDRINMPFIIPELLDDDARNKLARVDPERCFL